jgi:hypothetical protein
MMYRQRKAFDGRSSGIAIETARDAGYVLKEAHA